MAENIYKHIPMGTKVLEGTKVARLEQDPETGSYGFTATETAPFEYTVPNNWIYEVEDISPEVVLRNRMEDVLTTLEVYRDNRRVTDGEIVLAERRAFETACQMLEAALK